MKQPSRAARAIWAATVTVAVAMASVIAVPAAASAAPGSFTGVNVPAVSGTGVIGSTFTASLDTTGTSPTPTTVAYEWYRVDTNAVIQNGGSTLTATSALLGTQVYVIATLSAPGYTNYRTLNSPFSSTVRLGSFTGVNDPVVSGTGLIGSTFTASLDTAGTSPTPNSVDYTWYRADTNAVIQNGGTTLTATSTLLGTGVYVIAKLSAPDTTDYTTLNSAYSATVHLGSFTGVNDPVVSGTGLIGSTFTASLDTAGTSPTPSSVDYTWYRADTNAVIQNGGTTLTATSTLLGTGVYVIAKLSAPDTTDYTTLNSAYSATVHLGSFTGVNDPVVSGTGLIGSTFTASLDTAGTSPTPNSVDYTWYRADTNAVIQNGGTTLTATSTLLGTGVYVIAELSAPDTTDYATLNSAFSSTVHLGSFTAGDAPRLTGQNTLGGTLTASIDTSMWSPTPATVTWQWYLEDGTELTGATGATLSMTADLVGEVVYAVATLNAPDTQTYVVATPPSGKIAQPGIVAETSSTVVAGGTVTVTAWGLLFLTEYDLQLQSTPVALGSRMSAADGTIEATLTIPAGTSAGQHRIVLLRDGVEVAAIPITVTAAPVAAAAGAATLPATGVDETTVAGTAGLGLLVLSAGILLVVLRRRMRTGQH